MKTKLSRPFILAFMLIGVIGCRRSSVVVEKECVKNMEILDAAAHSYALERGLANSVSIDPHELAGFLRGGQVPMCSLGKMPYVTFDLVTGPSCPNSPDHTKAFREKRSKYSQSGQNTHQP